MSIPNDMIILLGAIVMAAAVSPADVTTYEASPKQRTSHVMGRSGSPLELNARVDGNQHREANGSHPIEIALSDFGIADVGIALLDVGIARSNVGIELPDVGVALSDVGFALTNVGVALTDVGIALSDTLRHSVRGGDVLIIDLPEAVNEQPVDGYSLMRAPALSWLIDYSFMWRTLPEDAGTHHVLLHAEGPAVSDTLVVAILVE